MYHAKVVRLAALTLCISLCCVLLVFVWFCILMSIYNSSLRAFHFQSDVDHRFALSCRRSGRSPCFASTMRTYCSPGWLTSTICRMPSSILKAASIQMISKQSLSCLLCIYRIQCLQLQVAPYGFAHMRLTTILSHRGLMNFDIKTTTIDASLRSLPTC